MQRIRSRKGATAIEFLVVGMTIALPLSFAMFYTAELLWVWHSVAEMTRDGAKYAATHCYQGGANVRAYMQRNAPTMPDRDQFVQGPAEIVINYYGRAADSNALTEFACDSECSIGCIPDVVKVQVTNYEWRTFLTYWGIPPVPIPDFQTVVAMEGAGCDPDSGTCIP